MKIATAHLASISPYSQGRHHEEEKIEGETSDAYERRTWRGKLHVNEAGYVQIPPMAFKNCLSEIAKFKSLQIPGKGKSTYTKHFEAGILVLEPMVLPVKAADVVGEWLFVPADGKRGGQKRVSRCFPVVPQWSGVVQFHVLDPVLCEAEKVFEAHLEDAGKFIGIGRFRPRNNGYYGRFEVKKVSWS